MTVDIAPSAPYLRQVAEAKSRLPGDRLDVARDEAIARFRSSGLPTPKLEAWKFTNLSALARTAFHGAAAPPEPAPSKASLAPYRLTADCHLAVFVNGRFRRDLSTLDHLPGGTRVVSLS